LFLSALFIHSRPTSQHLAGKKVYMLFAIGRIRRTFSQPCWEKRARGWRCRGLGMAIPNVAPDGAAQGGCGRNLLPLDCARGAIDTGRQSQPSLPKRSQGSDGGGPLTRTADISPSSGHTTHIHTHRQARFPHGRIKCCPNVSDIRNRHRKVTPRPQGQPFHGEPDMHRHAQPRSWQRQHPSHPHDLTGTALAAPGGTP
jgi:hypothetical protein